jgi:TrmH family RNA methyltransferase
MAMGDKRGLTIMAGNEAWVDELRRQLLQRQDPWIVLEGREVVEAALAGWWDIRGILAVEDAGWVPPVWSGLELTCVGREDMAAIAGEGFQSGVIGLAALPDERADVAGLLRESAADAVVVVCPTPEDEDHAGELVRHAAALGAAAVIFGDGGVSPYSRRAVRASAGALFRIPVRVADGGQVLRCLMAARFHLVGAAGEGEALRGLGGLKYEDRRRALVIGSENRGLDPFWRRGCDELVSIPLASSADSLGTSASAAVMLWQMMQR